MGDSLERNDEVESESAGCGGCCRVFLYCCSIICLIFFWPCQLVIIKEYERAVIFRIGRLVGAKGPGLILLLPCIDRMVLTDLRTVSITVPQQEGITKDSVTVRIDAVVFYYICDPIKSVVAVNDAAQATNLLAQTTLRSVVGQSELDEVLAQRDSINAKLRNILDENSEAWGVRVTAVEVKDILIPPSMVRAMASQAEAERNRRAKIITSDGEFQASARLKEAADIIASQPGSMQLRFLQTISQIGHEQNNTVVVPFPSEMLGLLSRSAPRS